VPDYNGVRGIIRVAMVFLAISGIPVSGILDETKGEKGVRILIPALITGVIGMCRFATLHL